MLVPEINHDGAALNPVDSAFTDNHFVESFYGTLGLDHVKAGFKYRGFHLERTVPYAVGAVTEAGKKVGLVFKRVLDDRPGIMKTPLNNSGVPQNQMIFNPHFRFGSDGRCILIPVGQIIEQIL